MNSQAPKGEPRSIDFEKTIARIGRTHPTSPAVLNERLAYAEFLLNGAPGPCAQRLQDAQAQLASVESSADARVMFPDGWARVSDLEYRLHLARTECGGGAGRADELRSAVTAALRAVELYRNVFDYRSMVIMQFDAAVALHRLGEVKEAMATLRAALDMDWEYGFRSDAEENYRLMLAWQDKPAGPTQIAALMQHFPTRRATFKFAWRVAEARVTLENHRERLEDDQVVQSRATAILERHVSVGQGGGWNVSYAHPLTQYMPGVWPTSDASKDFGIFFPPARLPEPSYQVSAGGEFEGAVDSDAFASELDTRTAALIRARAPPGPKARQLTQDAVEMMSAFLSPGLLEAAAAQNYDLETAMWIGATLEQGVWYEIAAPLSLPGIPRVVVQHQIEFAFTRTVPCTAGATDAACVEIVLRATPDRQALDRVMADTRAQLPDFRDFRDYSASIEARIVTDPTTLLPYAHEERLYWYASVGTGRAVSALESEHLVSTTSYGAQQVIPGDRSAALGAQEP